MRIHPCSVLAAAWLLGILSAPAVAREWTVDADAPGTKFGFHSEATLESFEGESSALSGSFVVDPTDLRTLAGSIEADLRQLDTGIGLRNKHMRDNVLETDEHPVAVFTLVSCDVATWNPAQPLHTKLRGSMSLHGVEQELEADVVVELRADGRLVVAATFPIRLSDFAIKRPKMLMMKVAEIVDVEVRVVASPASGD